MEKIKLTKAQADAIESALLDRSSGRGDGRESVVVFHTNHRAEWGYERRPLCDLSLDVLIRALYVGYEVEKTQEQREADVLEYFNQQKQMITSRQDSSWFAIIKTLDLLDVHIGARLFPRK